MTDIIFNMSFILISYLLGSLTVGYYIVRYTLDCDIREFGSGSVGATNVSRLLGSKGFVLTFVGDMGKGGLALLLAQWVGCQPIWLAFILIAVVVGHIWPIQLRFKGGKGVATALGGLTVYDPMLALITICSFVILYLVFKDREFSGIIVIICLPIFSMLINRPLIVTTVCFITTLLLLWAHRENILAKCRWKDPKESVHPPPVQTGKGV